MCEKNDLETTSPGAGEGGCGGECCHGSLGGHLPPEEKPRGQNSGHLMDDQLQTERCLGFQLGQVSCPVMLQWAVQLFRSDGVNME